MAPSFFFSPLDYASVVVFLIYCFLHVLNLHFVMLQGFQPNFKNAFTSHAELNVHRRPRGPHAGKWGCGEREWGDWFQLCRNTSGAVRHPCADFFWDSNKNFPWLQMATVIWSDLHHVWRDCTRSRADSASRTAGPSLTGIRWLWHFQLPQSSSSHHRCPHRYFCLWPVACYKAAWAILVTLFLYWRVEWVHE